MKLHQATMKLEVLSAVITCEDKDDDGRGRGTVMTFETGSVVIGGNL